MYYGNPYLSKFSAYQFLPYSILVFRRSTLVFWTLFYTQGFVHINVCPIQSLYSEGQPLFYEVNPCIEIIFHQNGMLAVWQGWLVNRQHVLYGDQLNVCGCSKKVCAEFKLFTDVRCAPKAVVLWRRLPLLGLLAWSYSCSEHDEVARILEEWGGRLPWTWQFGAARGLPWARSNPSQQQG